MEDIEEMREESSKEGNLPHNCRAARKGWEEETVMPGSGGKVEMGGRVAEDGENRSNSNRPKPSFLPIVYK